MAVFANRHIPGRDTSRCSTHVDRSRSSAINGDRRAADAAPEQNRLASTWSVLVRSASRLSIKPGAESNIFEPIAKNSSSLFIFVDDCAPTNPSGIRECQALSTARLPGSGLDRPALVDGINDAVLLELRRRCYIRSNDRGNAIELSRPSKQILPHMRR